MQIIKKKEGLGRNFFLMGIILELLVMMVGHSQATLPLVGRITHVAFGLFGCKILMTQYTKKEWLIIILTGILGAVSYVTCKDEYVIRAIVLVLASKDIEWKKIIRTILAVAFVGTILIIILSIFGILGERVDIRDYGRGAVEARWCLGFSHANNLHGMFWYLLVLIFLIKNRFKWWHYAIMLAVDVVLYMLSASRTGFLVSGMLIVSVAILQYFPKWNKCIGIYVLGVFALVTCICLTVLGAIYGLHNPFIRFMDRFLNQRLNMCFHHANLSQWQLFPEYRSFEKAVDNGFGAFFYQYGIVLGILLIVSLFVAIIRLYHEQNGVTFMVLITYIFVYFMETTFIFNTSLLCNVFLVVLFERWYRLAERGEKVEFI